MTSETVIVASTLILAAFSLCAVVLQGTKQFFIVATVETFSLIPLLVILFSAPPMAPIVWTSIILFLQMHYTWYMKADDVTFGPWTGLFFEMIYNAKKKQVEAMESKKVVDIS